MSVACSQVADVLQTQEFVEKPLRTKSNLAFSELMIDAPELVDAIPQTGPADIGFDFLPKLAGRMLASRLNDYVLDIGTPENYRFAQATWPGI
jgi:NDP-sugar pyrophosphorylase family protein